MCNLEKLRSLSSALMLGSLLALLQSTPLRGEVEIPAPQNWSGERIALPPGFAKDMKFKGYEKIRFAPGMFDANSNSFFSYVLVFSIANDSDVSIKNLKSELLKYYRGLATAVMKGQQKTVDTSKFDLDLKALQKTKVPDDKVASQLVGTLNWIEPFRTQKDQSLRIKIDVRVLKDGQPTLLFIQASPAKFDATIWDEMAKIRNRFLHSRSAN